jgi:hypothetical protein
MPQPAPHSEIPGAGFEAIEYPVRSVGPLMGDIQWAGCPSRPPGPETPSSAADEEVTWRSTG